MTSFALTTLTEKKSSKLGVLWTILFGSLFLGLVSQISIPLYFTPVALSLQSLAVLTLGIFLGGKKSALSVLTYLGQGAMGLPVFAGGKAGLVVLMGPAGGYYMGFVLAAFSVGYLLERGSRPFLALSLGSALILACGTLWLAAFVGPAQAVLIGCVPFVAGDLLKTVVASGIIKGR